MTRHPDWDYRLWTDDDNRQLVVDHFPSLLKLYDGYTTGIKRADLARYLVMCRHGGLYVDLDFECLRPVEALLAGSSLAFGLEPDTHVQRIAAKRQGLDKIICNAFIASVPESPFWRHLLARLEAASDVENVLDATGPFILTRAYDEYPFKSEITLLSSALVYPLDGDQIRNLSVAEQRGLLGNAFALHHWDGTWWREPMLASARQRIQAARRPS
jgi:mannosyltransferase OCH1-like enzyme